MAAVLIRYDESLTPADNVKALKECHLVQRVDMTREQARTVYLSHLYSVVQARASHVLHAGNRALYDELVDFMRRPWTADDLEYAQDVYVRICRRKQ